MAVGSSLNGPGRGPPWSTSRTPAMSSAVAAAPTADALGSPHHAHALYPVNYSLRRHQSPVYPPAARRLSARAATTMTCRAGNSECKRRQEKTAERDGRIAEHEHPRVPGLVCSIAAMYVSAQHDDRQLLLATRRGRRLSTGSGLSFSWWM